MGEMHPAALGFRTEALGTSTSYDRFYEGRKDFGDMVGAVSCSYDSQTKKENLILYLIRSGICLGSFG